MRQDSTAAKQILCLLCLLLVVGMLPGCQDQAGEWLRLNAVPLETVEPGSGYADLEQFAAMVGDARIVALGEATHGTREFYRLKHRLIEFLVTEMGFELIAVEASWPDARRIDDYVHTCSGNEVTLLAGLRYWTWSTQEMLDLLNWMCDLNTTAGDGPRTGFAGFDMQSPVTAMDDVEAYFEEVDPEYVRTVGVNFSCLRMSPLADYAERPDERRNSCRARLQEVYDRLREEQETYTELSSAQEYALAEHSARVVLQAEDCLADFDSCNRDQYMAQNVAWLLEQAGPDARIVIWAHNDHVADRTTPEGRRLGSYLREMYGDEMLVAGLVLGEEGTFNAITYQRPMGRLGGIDVHEIPNAPRSSYEWYLSQAEIPLMLLDLRVVSETDPEAEWLLNPSGLRSIGATYDPMRPAEEYAVETDLVNEFDLIIYVDPTTPSTLLSLAAR